MTKRCAEAYHRRRTLSLVAARQDPSGSLRHARSAAGKRATTAAENRGSLGEDAAGDSSGRLGSLGLLTEKQNLESTPGGMPDDRVERAMERGEELANLKRFLRILNGE
jgi:hypothetical protein